MGRWVRYFLGTPQRVVLTLIGIGFIICLFSPSAFEFALISAVNAIFRAVSPLLGPVLAVLIVLAGIKLILGGHKR